MVWLSPDRGAVSGASLAARTPPDAQPCHDHPTTRHPAPGTCPERPGRTLEHDLDADRIRLRGADAGRIRLRGADADRVRLRGADADRIRLRGADAGRIRAPALPPGEVPVPC
ncbi:pentapeptide repeat-containing protein [Streptomyces sp. NPDC007325]|uniref:pentapeptide repeat-containing protein n=1 Tax=Streptomyces sp. NPDC007325 TaxID=3154588 RepID=UPI0033DB6311